MHKSADTDRLVDVEMYSPGEGAYRVELSGHRIGQISETLLVGQSGHEQLSLLPGTYSGRIFDIGRRIFLARDFEIEVAPDGGEVHLSQEIVSQASEKSDRKGRNVSEAQLRQAYRASREGRVEAKQREKSEIIKGGGKRKKSIFKSAEPRSERPVEASSRFSIGLSQDHVIGERGGWSIPDNVETNAVFDAETRTLSIFVEEQTHPENAAIARTRMSMLLAGAPAIRIPVPLYREGVTVLFTPVVVKGEQGFIVEIKAVDEKIEALVDALHAMSSTEARDVLEWCKGDLGDDAVLFLYQKKRDFWRAALAALVLVKTGDISEGQYAQWAYNLEKWAPHIPDASVAAAWARVMTGNDERRLIESQALSHLKRGGSVGAPVFNAANDMALELLDSLRSTAVDSKVRADASREYKRWANRSRMQLYKSPYLIWEQSGPNLQEGILPDERYGLVQRGFLSEKGFRRY